MAEPVTSIHRRDAEAAGKYAAQLLLKGLPKKSMMTRAELDETALWASRWAGHWAHIALQCEERYAENV